MYFSKKKERMLKNMYGIIEDDKLKRILGMSNWLFENKIKELGLVKETVVEIDSVNIFLLIKDYKEMPNALLSNKLGIPKMIVEHNAFRLGLRKKDSYWANIFITAAESDMIEQWNTEYDHTIHGGSRGNYVLGKALKQMFPMHNIQPEYPIGGLRLDYYMSDMKIGFEYQGIQHEQFNNFHFATKDDFRKAQNRDYEKSSMCEAMGIPIVYIYHDESLTMSLLMAKISEVL